MKENEIDYKKLYEEEHKKYEAAISTANHNIFGKILSILLKETNRLENGEKIELSITKILKK